MSKKEYKEEPKEKSKIINKIDMDNGYFPYAKDIGRTLARTYLNGSHRAIIDCILDLTYGWYDPKSEKVEKFKKRKTEERITYRIFEDFTGITNKHLSKYILALVDWKVIKRRKRGQCYLYSFNVNVNQWNKGVLVKTTPHLRGSLTVSLKNKGISDKTTPRTGGALNYPSKVGRTTPRTRGTLPHERGVLAGSKTNTDKPLLTPNKLFNKTYIKKGEKENIYTDKNLREEKEIFDYWNSLDIFEHKTFKFFKDDIKETLKNYSLEGIKNSIKNYSLILKGEEYYYSYEHTISGFLDPKNFEKFRDLEKAKKNYLRRRVNGETDSEEYNIPKYEPGEKEKKTKEEIIAERERISKLAGEAAKELRKKKN